MANIREQRIYCAEQIVVPPELPAILKHYSKEVIRNNPENIMEFSRDYFKMLLEKRGTDKQHNEISELEKPDSKYQVQS